MRDYEQDWWDFQGHIHHQKPKHKDQKDVSENGILMTAAYLLFYAYAKGMYRVTEAKKAAQAVIREDGTFRNYPHGGLHFSHDNMTGLYILSYLGTNRCNKLPIVRWNGGLWLHPRDILFYSLMKLKHSKFNMLAGLLYLISLPLFMIMTTYSFMDSKEETSGNLLWCYRALALQSKPLCGIIKFILKKRGESVQSLCSTYFQHKDHPIHKLSPLITMEIK